LKTTQFGDPPAILRRRWFLPAPRLFDAGHMPTARDLRHAERIRHLRSIRDGGDPTMADTVQYEVSDGRATITINRPEAMNATNTEAKVALREAVKAAAADPAVRAVLLTATGRAFCVGQD